jgi:hypothetical protein
MACLFDKQVIKEINKNITKTGEKDGWRKGEGLA